MTTHAKTRKNIADEYGVSTKTLSRWFTKHNIVVLMIKILAYSIIFSFFVINFYCCKPPDPILPFEGKKIVLYALLMPDTTIEVNLSQSQASLDKMEPIPIEYAEVILYKDNTPLDTLDDLGNGLYRAANNVQLKEAGIYHVQVKANGFPDAASKPEQVPYRPKVLAILTSSIISNTGNASVAFSLEPNVENSPGLAQNFVSSDSLGHVGRYGLGFLDGCPEGGGTSNPFFSCYNIDCSTDKNIFHFEAWRLLYEYKASGWIAYTSKAFLDFHTDYQRQYDATLDPIFYEPLNVRSNVLGGYGAVVAFSPTWVSFKF